MSKFIFTFLILAGFNLSAQPSLKGGLESFLRNNKVYPKYSLSNCIDGTVNVAFKLNDKGVVYYSEVRNGIGTDLDAEALRLIRMSSGKWLVPADHDSTVFVITPINFKLSDCLGRSKQEIKAAIDAYKANTDLTNAVLAYYRDKEQNRPTGITDAKAQELKETLGYDDDYLSKRLEDGKKKLKQRDFQGACEDFKFVKYMGSAIADDLLAKHCK
ncbi:MAG: energy transducer TonB [Pedobacter sp.]|nr:MAG: energy transducer TonB [Pedobacter sp.]